MKTNYLTLALLTVCICSYGQNTLTKYYSFSGAETTKEKAYSYHKITSDSIEIYIEEYKMDGQIIMSGTYKANQPKIENGLFTFYNSNRVINATGYYENGILMGIWKTYDDRGEIKNSVDYDIFKRIEYKKYDTIYDGNDQRFSNNKNNDLIKVSYAKDVRYPNLAFEREKSGKVSVEFIINKKGEITNLRVLESVDKDLDREAMRVIASHDFGELEPYKLDGKPVNVKFVINVNFVLL